jgi:hypothetical protein
MCDGLRYGVNDTTRACDRETLLGEEREALSYPCFSAIKCVTAPVGKEWQNKLKETTEWRKGVGQSQAAQDLYCVDQPRLSKVTHSFECARAKMGWRSVISTLPP